MVLGCIGLGTKDVPTPAIRLKGHIVEMLSAVSLKRFNAIEIALRVGLKHDPMINPTLFCDS